VEKPAETAYPIEDLLRRRWSPRAFSQSPVEPEKLLRLWEAARWSASCYNEQPWHFIVATKDEETEYARMLSCLIEGNQAWASAAPVLMVSVARLEFAHNGAPNRHALHDVGMATAQMMFQATAMGLFVHAMAGFHPDKVRELYGVPEKFEPVAAIAVGYPGDPVALPDNLREREFAPRARKSIEAFVFRGQFRG
jgi:nitroreductase